VSTVARGTVALGLLLVLGGCHDITLSLGGDRPPTPQADAGAGCVYDIDCAPWHGLCLPDGGCQALTPDGGWVCDPTSGPQPCILFATGPDFTYCTDSNGANLCYCHPDSYFDQGGVCYRAIPECGGCTNSVDCGGTQTDLNNGVGSTCLPVADAGNFCLFTYAGGCDKGFSQQRVDGIQVCYPHCNTCPCSFCISNSDCPAIDAGICSSTGACVPPCLTATDCPPGEVCHVLGKYLNPGLGVLYGGGQCGASCGASPDCSIYQGDSGTPLLACMADRFFPDGGNNPGDAGARCRVDGCMKDDECIQTANDAGALTWCDLWSPNTCVDSYCQLGVVGDGGVYSSAECQKGYWCVEDAGVTPQNDSGPAHGVCSMAP
jgi:hypothetical protein